MTENDLIVRQAAIDAICKVCANGDDYTACRDRDIKSRWCDNITALRDLPSAQPEIIYCQECIKADLCAWRREGAKYCSYSKRRTDED